MGLLDDVLGGSEARSAHEDFANRVEQGAPDEGYTDQEALDHHQQVASKLSKISTSRRLWQRSSE